MQRKNNVLATILIVGLVVAPSVSRAAIAETIIETDSDTAIGSIIFPDVAGKPVTEGD